MCERIEIALSGFLHNRNDNQAFGFVLNAGRLDVMDIYEPNRRIPPGLQAMIYDALVNIHDSVQSKTEESVLKCGYTLNYSEGGEGIESHLVLKSNFAKIIVYRSGGMLEIDKDSEIVFNI